MIYILFLLPLQNAMHCTLAPIARACATANTLHHVTASRGSAPVKWATMETDVLKVSTVCKVVLMLSLSLSDVPICGLFSALTQSGKDSPIE